MLPKSDYINGVNLVKCKCGKEIKDLQYDKHWTATCVQGESGVKWITCSKKCLIECLEATKFE